MRIAVFSMGPLFPHHVHGGSQKLLQTVLINIGKQGHKIDVYCTRRDDNFQPFHLSPNVFVQPVLCFKQVYPDPYWTAPYNLTNIVLTLAQAIESHDVFYIHDSQLAFHFLYTHIPTVVTFQDFVYPDTLSNAFSFKRDHLILNSLYVKKCFEATFAPFRQIAQERLSLVPNGFNTQVFRKVDATKLRNKLGLASDTIPILYPHRPDPQKGLYEALLTVSRLKQHLPQEIFKRIKLLVPIWMDSNIVKDENHIFIGIYKEILHYAQTLDLPDVLHFHPWLPVQNMPEYYSLGRATLCIGNFIESFGQVSVESELCGTPSIISRVGAQRFILPEDISQKIDYKDEDAAAEILARILAEGPKHTTAIREYITTHYSEEQMLSGYAQQILNTKLLTPLEDAYTFRWSNDDTFEIPPWCAMTSNGYYNDYAYGYCHDQQLLDMLDELSFPVRIGDIKCQGGDEEKLIKWINDGVILRRPAQNSSV